VGASNKGEEGKKSYILALCVDSSKTVRDTAKVSLLLVMTNRKLHVRFQLAPRSMTLDDIELLQVQFFSEFCATSHF